jgi:hypothetical protein
MQLIIRRADGDRLVPGIQDGFIGILRAKANRVEVWRDDGSTHLCNVPAALAAVQINVIARVFDADRCIERTPELVAH